MTVDVRFPGSLRAATATALVGRDEQLQTLAAAWAAATQGARQLVLVGGEAGVGKTRLVADLARLAHDDGAIVLHGECTGRAPVPYQPFAEALRAVADVDHPAMPEGAREALGVLVPGGPSDRAGPTDPEAERYKLAMGVSELFGWLTASAPVLLVLDDLHWAGATTMQLLDHLVRGDSLGRVAVVATFRTEPAEATDAFRSGLPELRRRPGTSRVMLAGLDAAAIRDFVESATGHALHIGLERVVGFLADQTDGNALLLGELWEHLVDEGHLVRPQQRWRIGQPLDTASSPPSVQDLVAARMATLPEATRTVVEGAAVMGSSFTASALAAALHLDPSALLEHLDPAVTPRIIREGDGGRLRFGHALIQRAVYDQIPIATRRRLHHEIARQLMQSGDDHLVEAAYHLVAAFPMSDVEVVISTGRRAARRSVDQVGYEDAARLLESVLEVIGPHPARLELLLQQADAWMRAGDNDAARIRCVEAHGLAERDGDHLMMIRAALALADTSWRAAYAGDTEERIITSTLPVADDERHRIQLEAALGRTLALRGRGDEAHRVAGSALDAARALGDAEAINAASTAVLFAPWTPETIDRQLDVSRDLIDLGVAVADAEWEAGAHDKLIYGLVTKGRLDEAREASIRFGSLARRLGQPFFQVLDLQARSTLATGEGRFEVAEQLATEALELGTYLSDDVAAGGFGVQMFGIRRAQGRLDEARAEVEAVARSGEAGATWRPALAVLYAELGLLDDAKGELRRLIAADLAAVPRDALFAASLSYLVDVCVACDDPESARRLHPHLLPHQGLIIQVGSLLGAYGAADRYLGQLAALAGDTAEAHRRFEAALRLETACRMPVWAATTQLAYGRLLATSDDSDDRDRARSMLRVAADTATRLGMRSVRDAANDHLAGLAGGGEGDTDPPPGLTAREAAVLELLVEGSSNRAIGERLHISHHTAANHVRAILLKTGCANRTEAAAWAVRAGLGGGRRR